MKICSQMRYFAVIISLLMLAACGGGKKVAPTVIPADASMVMAFDLKNLTGDAVELKDIFSKEFLESMTKDEASSSGVSQIMNSGMDLTKPAYFFSKFDKNEDNMYFGFSFKIADAKKFAEGVKKLENAPEVKTEGDYTFGIKEGIAVVWNEKAKDGLIYGMPDAKDDDVKAAFMKVLKTEPANSLDNKNAEFKAMLRGRYDIGMWLNYEDFTKMTEDAGGLDYLPADLQDLNKLAKAVTGHINFEKGELKFSTKSYVDKEILEKYKDIIKDKVDDQALVGAGIEEPSMMFAFGLGIKGVQKLLKGAGMLNGAAQMEEALGLSADDLFGMLTGDMAMVTGNMNFESMRNPEVEFSVGLGLAEKKTYEKLMTKVSSPMFGIKEKDGFYVMKVPRMPFDFYILEKNDVMYVTNNEKIKDNIKAGKKIKGEYSKMLKGTLGATYIDLGKIMKAIPKDIYKRDESMSFFMEKYAGEFKSVSATSSPYKNGVSEGEMVLKMNNSRNTLSFLMGMFKEMAEKNKIPV